MQKTPFVVNLKVNSGKVSSLTYLNCQNTYKVQLQSMNNSDDFILALSWFLLLTQIQHFKATEYLSITYNYVWIK